jgi:amino acid adenylation domain-containing protein
VSGLRNYSQYLSLHHLLESQAARIPQAVAIAAPERAPLTYNRLLSEVDAVARTLQAMGIGRNDCVALTLPDGPQLAVTFLGVAARATYAPLNPAYKSNEFEFFFDALRPKALVVESSEDCAAVAVARRNSIPVLELSQLRANTATTLGLENDKNVQDSLPGLAGPDDVALILFTSGTTSRPKLVPLTHGNLTASAIAIAATLQLTHDDRCLNVMPLFHIHGLVAGLLASLVAGASVVCAPGFYAPEFFGWLDEFRPTWYTATPTMHQLILTRAHQHVDTIRRCSLRFIRSSSAALPSRVITELEETFRAPVIESYGMTEAAHQMASNPLAPRQRKRGSVGIAAGPELAIMDETGNFLPTGVVGEVVVRGPSIMNGYSHAPEANASAFTRGWFRTGDLGYFDSEAYLFLTGRIKELINRGGEKITPLEVDDVLMDHPSVFQAVTFAVPHPTLGEEVAAAVVLHGQANVTAKELREFSATRLADFKVPRHISIVKELPEGSTRKLQRIGLAKKLGITAIDAALTDSATVFEPPQTALEAKIAAIWTQVLGLPEIGRHDDFLRLGGDSILAARIIARLSKALGVEISMIDLFDAPTVRAFTQTIEAKQKTSGEASPLHSVPRDRPLPLSYAQEALWFLHRLEPGTAIYNRPSALRLTGRLDVMAMEQSINEMLRRHEALRTTFPLIDGEPAQVIMPAQPFRLSTLDLTSIPATERDVRARELAAQEAQRPFDLVEGPLLRATLLILDEQDQVLLVTLHHIISDGWSGEVFFHDLAKVYTAIATGQPISLPPLPVQYADFSLWQRDWLQGKRLDDLLAYWKQQLAGDLPVLELPKDQSRKTGETNHPGAHHKINLSGETGKALRTLSQKENVTLFMTLLAAFNTLLHRYTGQEDLLVGSPIAGRNREETEGVVGNFINMLVLRTDLSGNPSFRELLRRVLKVTLQAYAHQDLPLVKLTEELHFDRRANVPAPFRVIFELRNLPRRSMEFACLRVAPFAFDDGLAQFDFSLEVSDTLEGLSCTFEYDTSLFDLASIARMANQFQVLLEGIVANPDQNISDLPILTEAERHQLLVQWNDTAIDYPQNKCINELFEAQVEKSPEAVAVVFEDKQLTYEKLNQRANQVAHYLRKLGVGPETLVSLCVERSLEMIVGLLGILKAGGAYVPLDPGYPKERLAFMLEETQASILLAQRGLLENLSGHRARVVCLDTDWEEIARENKQNPSHQATAENLAYVIYTSGSTGKPKGAMITHGGLINYLNYCLTAYPINEGRGSVIHSSIAFDATITALFTPLLAGRALYLLPQREDLEALATILRRMRDFSVVKITPAHLAMLSQQIPPEELKGLTRAFVIGGENLVKEQIAFWQKHAVGTLLFNEYGPTETVVGCIVYEASKWQGQGSVPIGRAIANTRVYVLDKHHQPVPVGVSGELYLGGAGVARGYLSRPELTAERFIPNPFSDDPRSRLYKTGDLARYQPDGNIEFLGRIDHQVKIRGFRVEVGEIEAVLCKYPGARETAVMAREDVPGDRRVVAYLVSRDGMAVNVNELRNFLREKLPEYMIPSVFVALDMLPLTPNGKLDRQALPAPNHLRDKLDETYAAPRTEVEAVIEEIWLDVLGLEQVSVDDNFFNLGGHSLLGVELISRLREEFHTDLSVRSVFESPTIRELALRIEDEQKDSLAIKSKERGWKYLVELRAANVQKPVFFLPGGYGGDFEFLVYARFVHYVGSDHSFYGLKAQSADGTVQCHASVEEMAEDYIREIRSIQPKGPYFLVGNCIGGVVAYEIAQQLQAQGQKVALLALMDTVRPTRRHYLGYRTKKLLQPILSWYKENYYVKRISVHRAQLRKLSWREKLLYLSYKTQIALKEIPRVTAQIALADGERTRGASEETRRIKEGYIQTLRRYRPRPYQGRLIILISEKSYRRDPAVDWANLVSDGIEVIKATGDHETYIRQYVQGAAKLLRACLEKVEVEIAS